MGSQKDDASDVGEDIPSDFFDDFNKDEFMEGLSVIDECWDDAHGGSSRDSQTRISAEALDNVKDLRELIKENNGEEKIKRKPTKRLPYVVPHSKYRWRKPESPQESDIDNFIKPGSRRDPSKTNEAIKKDKEVKVQQFLAKSLESSDDLRPPGTELDDYYEEEKKKDSHVEEYFPSKGPTRSTREHFQSPPPMRYSPRMRRSPRMWRSPRGRFSPSGRFNSRGRFSPRGRVNSRGRHSPRQRYSPKQRFSPHENPRHFYRNLSPPHFKHRNTMRKYSPMKHMQPRRHYSPQRRSPVRHSPQRRSPHRFSPVQHSPRRQHHSRSPHRRLSSRRSHSHSRSRSPHHNDSFLYPNNPDPPSSGYPVENPSYQPELGQQYNPQMHPEFSGCMPGYYPQVPAYGGGFSDAYNYGVPQVPQPSVSGPVIIPNVNPAPAPAPPPMVPAPTVPAADKATPYDALAQLVAEGKISQEDYLKLTPNKGVATTMDTKTRVMVLTRCNQALSKLDKLFLPNRLVMNQTIDLDDKYLSPKYCSPLKRQAVTEFSFTKGSVSPAQQTKQLVETIVSTLGLDKVISKYKKKLPKDMKDAAIQTTKPQCDICEVRESTKYHDVGTSTDPEYFTSTVHTQVVEQDLVSSKSIFNPSGSMSDRAPISIAHLTPAQLVSQLAARAKTLKQPPQEPPPSQFSRRPPSNYDYDGRGGQYHHSYNNYRY